MVQAHGSRPHDDSSSLAFSPLAARALVLLTALFAAFWVPPAAASETVLGTGVLEILGSRLTVSPSSQTVPFDVPTTLDTSLEGFDLGSGPVPPGLRVRAELRGPEIDGVLALETAPGQPLRIPALRLEGEYLIENIRLVDGETLLSYASPRSAVVQVTQVLVTRVTSRPLTLEEIRSLGIVVGDDSFQMFRFVFGFGVDGEEIVVEFPASAGGVFVAPGRYRGGDHDISPPRARFRPPQLVPFRLDLPSRRDPELFVPEGGCPPELLSIGCRAGFGDAPMVGVIAIPTDVALLNQFFSVVLMVQNGAPEGDPLVLRDLAARITLPPSLRQAETVPATSLGVPVPIRVPGLDGELGTADDLTFLVAQAEGEAEFLVEGLEEGSHVVRFDIDGVLDGLPSGPRAVSGEALGAVVVRDPHLQVTINHPEVVRTDEAYAMHMTVSNLGPAPVNLLSVTLPTFGLSGTSVVGDSSRSIESLLPGEAETVTFDMVALRTGRVVASTARTGPNISPSFELSVGVSTEGIPLSPDAIVLPDRVTEVVPESIARPALSLLGLGHSLATARPSDLPPNLLPVGGDALVRRVYRLAQAAQHVAWGEDPFDSYAVFAAEWQGARDGDADWDALRRVSGKGRDFAAGIGAVLEAEAQQTSPRQMAERFAATTGFLPEHAVVLAGGTVDLVLRDSAGREAAGVETEVIRDLPFAELYSAGTDATLGLITRLHPAGHVARLVATATGTVDLDILLPTSSGIESLRWTGVSMNAGDTAEVAFGDGGASPTLLIDRFDDGVVDDVVPATVSTVPARPFAVIAARQNVDVDPTGHVVDVLFTRDVDRAALAERVPSRFEIDGLISDGGALGAGEVFVGGFEVSDTQRLVRALFDNPIGPVSDALWVRDIRDSHGAMLPSQLVDLAITQTTPGGVVEGTVIGSNGQPVPFAVVELFEHDQALLRGGECVEHKTGAVRADASGRFHFPFVRATSCDNADRFRLEAIDPADLAHGDAIGRVRFTDQVTTLNVVMIGRGRVEGRVTYEDGSPVSGLEVRVFNPVFEDGRIAHVGADGRFDADDIMVGAVEISANDDSGRFAFATVELPSAGEIVSRDLVIVRSAPDPTGQVRGTATSSDGAVTIENAILALYVDDVFIGTTTSESVGRFDFGTVLAGTAEIEIFDPETAASGGRVFFEIAPDAVVDIDVPLRDARATVEGRVLRQRLDGAVVPVAGAIVWLSGQQANTVSNDDGTYRLEGVLAGDQLQVFAADPRTLERVNASLGSVVAGGTLERDLLFIEQQDASGAITGQVLDFDGLPVVGALVHVSNSLEGAISWSFEAVTDSNGQFVLRGTALDPTGQPVDVGFDSGTYALHAIAGSFGAVAPAEIRFPGDTPYVTLQLERGQVRIRTAARQADGSEIGVLSQVQWRPTVVEFGLVREATFPTTVETDANGDLVFDDVLIGPYELFVSNAFHGERLIRGRLTDHGQENVHEIVFEETTGAVRGRVLDFDGVTPVAGVEVQLSSRHIGAFDVTTDAEGRYAFELVPIGRSFTIVATLDSNGVFRTARTGGGLSRGGQVIEGVDIVLPKRGSVIGLVEDADGVRVPGAVVTLSEHAYPHRRLSSTADQDGNFAFEGVMAGGFAVRAQAPSLGGLGGRSGGFITDEGQVVETVITLEATGELIGRVISPVDGSPVPSARIRLEGGGSLIEAIDADENGAYRFRLLPLDVYKIRAFDPSSGRHGESQSVTIGANGERVTADVVLQVRGEVAGRVLAPTEGGGTVPIPGATVRLDSRTSFFDLVTHSSTDTDGVFLFGGVPEGDFDVSVREPGGRRRATGAGTIGMEDEIVTVDLVLEAFGAVVGSVLQPPGAPAGLYPDANVRLLTGRRLIAASLDNPYVLDGLLPGEGFELRAEALDGAHRGIVSGRMPDEGGALAQDVVMLGRGQVVVTVVDSFGNPVPGVDVTMTARNALGWQNRTASTGADNRVTFADVEAASITIRARDPFRDLRGGTSGALTLDGESVSLTVMLEDTGFVEGIVVLSDGVTPATDVIIALQVGGDFRFAQADSDGGFRFDAVPLGAWSLSIQEDAGLGRFEAIGSIDSNGEVDDLGLLVLDEADPTVIAITPDSGVRDVPTATSVMVAFSEPIDVARWRSDSVILRRFGHNPTPATATWNDDDTVVTLTPTSPLVSDALYEIFVTTHVVDRAGRSLPDTVRSTFNTADVVPPAVIDILPRDGENQIDIASPIVIAFSEPVVETSLSGSSLALYDLTSNEGVTTTFQLRPSGREAILTAAFGLVADRQYRVTVQNVTDASGNVMSTPMVTTFWTVDETFPEGTFLSPDAGSTFTAGDLIDASITATDNRGVDTVTFHLVDGGFAAADAGDDTYVASFPAPRVTSAQDLTLQAEIVDIFGNVTVLERAIRVEPRVNASAPTVTAPCLHTGDQVRPGRDLELPFTVTDDQGVERYSLFVDGALVEQVRFQHLGAIDDTFVWSMPVTALPGTTFAIRLEATDYAGNVGGYEAIVETPSGLILDGDMTLDASMVDGQQVTLDAGTYAVTESLVPASLALLPGATLVSPTGLIDITVTHDLRVQCGAEIDVDAGGYAAGSTGSPTGGSPSGIAGSEPDAGGSHGGLGIAHDNAGPAGETYGSVYAPTSRGGGGALAWPSETGAGGAGGGRVRLAGTEIVLGGDVTARGMKGEQGGSGAGGSIWIEAGTVTGAGVLDASGADFTWCPALFHRLEGAGGGGRIALDVGVFDRFDPATQARAHGGQLLTTCTGPRLHGIAGAGTVFIHTAQSSYGELLIDGGAPRGDGSASTANDPFEPAPTPLPRLGEGTVVSSTVDGADLWVEGSEAFRSRWLGAWMRLESADGTVLGGFEVVEIDATGRLRLAGASAATDAVLYRGEYRFDAVISRNRGQAVFSSPLVGEDLVFDSDATLGGQVEVANLHILSGATVRSAIGSTLDLEIAGTLTIETGAVLDADGAGFQGPVSGFVGVAPEGLAPAEEWGGASHGGRGRVPNPSRDVTNSVYGSPYWPRFAGAAAGDDTADGGGAVAIRATEIVLDGAIRARGQGPVLNGGNDPAGSGGSVLIEASSLRGGGTIDVSGGTTNRDGTGPVGFSSGGGGGRIALWVDDLSQFDVATQSVADGGTQSNGIGATGPYSAPGTIFVFDQSSVFGTLRVVQSAGNEDPIADTPLPVLGSGTVGAVTTDAIDASDLWIDDSGGRIFDLGLEGTWVRVLSTDFRVIAQSGDRRRLLLDGAAGAVMPGDPYIGVYKFDHVTVDDATLIFGDVEEVGTVEILGDGSIIAPFELDPPVVSLTPSDGAVVLRGDSVDFDATITDESGVETATLSIDGETIALTEAPWIWQWSAPMVTVATDYDYSLEVVDTQGNATTIARTIRVEPGAPPTIVSVLPAENATVSGGAVFEIVADVTDDAAVESVTFGFDGASFVDTEAPYGWSVLAPEVTASTPYTITVEALDKQQHTASLVRTIELVPGVTVEPPVLEIRGCVHDGIHALPSTALPIGLEVTATDEDTVSSWRVLVDGGEIAGTSGLVDESIEASTSWTVPASALPGDAFTVRFEAQTAAGGFVARDHVVTVPMSYLSGPLDLDASHDGQALVLGPGTFTAQGPLSPASLSMMNGARVVLDDALIPGNDLEIASTGSLVLACGATLDAVGIGYEGGMLHGEPGDAPSWADAADTEAGGGHGGAGWKGFPANTTGGGVFDSVYRPLLPGGGGGASVGGADAGHGGGVVRITASSVVLDGTVDARGTPNQGSPGHTDFVGTGAGGTIVIETASLVGDGAIDVRGGDDLGARYGGAGGGGRVAIYAGGLSGFDIENVRTRGGRGLWSGLFIEASAGTLYRHDGDSTWGTLRVAGDPDSTDVPPTALPALPSGTITASEAIGDDLWIAGASGFHPRWMGAWIDLEDSASAPLGTFQVSTIDAAGRVRVADAASFEATAAHYAGRYRFDAVELLNGANLEGSVLVELPSMALASGVHEVPPSIRMASLDLEDGAILRPTTSPMRLVVDSTLTVDAGATIDVKGRGYAGAPDNRSPGSGPPWASSPTRDGGSGSHGGAGLPGWNGSPGGVYGSVYRPRMGGGGGAGYDGRSADSDGTDGGGVLEITAGSVVLDGVLDASGEDRDVWAQGLGAGGSILIHAATLRGTGSIISRGGKYDASDWGGGGGGGRVSLVVGALQGFDPLTQVLAHGGRTTRWNDPKEATPGTIYVLESTDTWGRLYVSADAGAPTVSATTLPTLGSGDVTATDVDGNDLWITAPTTFHPRWEGAWIELFDDVGVPLGRFSVLEADALGRARVADAASHSTAVASYQGLYRFDTIVLGNGATTSAADEVEVASP